MKGPLAVIGAGLVAIAYCGPAAIIAAIAAIGLTGATGGLTAALLTAAAVIMLVAVRAGRRRRRCMTDESAPEQGPRSSTKPRGAVNRP